MIAFKLTTVIVLILFLYEVECKFEFTNIICTSLDKEFMDFDACFLKSKNRTYKFLTLRTKIFQLPFNDLVVRIELLKRMNGYKPFLYNLTTDVCDYFKGRRNPVVRFFYELFAPYSNLNHTCPYDHDILVNELPISFLDQRLTVVLPVPEGDYCVHTVYTIAGKKRLDVKVYARIY